ncbi:anion permease [Secundilactobacillus hailunensis]|uniref:Anion permease n=1 Tax=Secundilactobacillus hailunensis TaxID=2559923 RepID=A0ABW1T874_9LACO|nr:anion permease [Secundilactobacillus hailunensis]
MSLGKVKYRKFIAPLAVGIIIWLLTPFKPVGVSIAAWHMFAIFVATIIGCITQPLPIGGVAIIGFTITVLTGEVPVDTAIAGFGNTSIWLIVMAFFISRGFIKTGLGRRIAFNFVRLFGKRTLGLAYSLIGVDLVLAPATPSNTARAGGIMYPIIQSLAQAFGSTPKDNTQRKIGSFLIYSEFQGDIITSAMFLTAMAANPLAQSLAKPMGIHITWMNWFIAGLVPGLICLILVPFIIYKIFPPEIKETPNAKEWSEKQLTEMGKFSKPEKYMALVFVVALVLWVSGSFIGIDATTTAFVALSLLLLTGVLSWSDITKETGAWNTLAWFSVLVMMATQLNTLGFIPWLSKTIGSSLHGMNWILVMIILIAAYFYSHYLFASATAHVSAMYSAFLAVAIAAGVPTMLAALMLGFFGNLLGSTTHYSNGPAPILYGSGYVTQGEWWKMNALMGVVYLIIWIGAGSLWMKVIGMW